MRKLLALLALIAGTAYAQVSPLLQPGQIVGNAGLTAAPGLPISVLPFAPSGTASVAACRTNASLTGAAFIDNINVPNGDTVFLGLQSNQTQNGPWIVNNSGAWTRPDWYTSGSSTQAVIGMIITVAPGGSGSVCGGQTYELVFANGVAENPVTIDTSTTRWFQTNNYALASNGATSLRSINQHEADSFNILDFEGLTGWSGTIRRAYGNSTGFGGINCTASSTSITLAGVTIPTAATLSGAPSYNGGNASAEIPGCGNPGAVNSVNPGNVVTTFPFADSGTGYVPQQILTCSGGTVNTACQAIVYSTVVNALPTVASGGSGCSNGTQTFTGTTGLTGVAGTFTINNYFTVTGTVSGGVLQSPLASFVANGPYTENPVNISAEPVSGASCSVAPTINLSSAMGASTGAMYASGNYTTVPTNPVSFAPAALPIKTMTWASASGGTVTVLMLNYSVGSAAILPGYMFPGWTNTVSQIPVTISGASPSGYNGTYTATITGPQNFTFPLASNPGATTAVGTYTVAPSATGADVNFGTAPVWYGNPLVGTISDIVNIGGAGGGSTFTISNAAASTLSNGNGKVYLWIGNDQAAFTAATTSGATSVILPNPPIVGTGWESGYMVTTGATIGGTTHRWDFDCQGNYISAAINAASPGSGTVLTVSAPSVFRPEQGSIVTGCDLDAAGGLADNFKILDWDWLINNMTFENATTINIGWSYGGHSRESRLDNFYIINDGYNPLTFPVVGIDSEALDTRISRGNILQGFQQTAVYSGSGTGDVNYIDIHAEQVVGGPTFADFGAGNRWIGGSQADTPNPGFPGIILYNGFNNVHNTDPDVSNSSYAAQLGILVTAQSQQNIITNNRIGFGTSVPSLGCVDLSTAGNNIWDDNIGCSITRFGFHAYIVSALPTCNAAAKYQWALVTDALTPTYNGTLTGGSTTVTPVFCTGAAWTSH